MNLYLYGEITNERCFDSDVVASEIVETLDKTSEPITMYINSPGGSVFDGMAIVSAINRHGNVTAIVDGIAASAAAMIALSCQKTLMADVSMLMIHKSWCVAVGNAKDLMDQAAILNKIDGEYFGVVAKRGNLDAEKVEEIFSKDSYFTSNEAMELKLVDGLIKAKSVSNLSANMLTVNNVEHVIDQKQIDKIKNCFKPVTDYSNYDIVIAELQHNLI